MDIYFLLIFLLVTGLVFGNNIYPDKETKVVLNEEDTVRLSCSYDTSSSRVYLYWYRQYPNRDPQYILWKGARSYGGENTFDQRFQSEASQKATELIIKSVSLSDSALYYCALRGYGVDPLTFGNPITLTVIPKDVPNTPPTLSILSPVEGEGSDICLAAGFFPKDKKMILNEDNANELVTSNAELSASKTYYYAGFNKGSIKKCEMDGKETINTGKPPDSLATAEPKSESVQLDCPPSASNSSVSTNTGDPKMNSVTLLMTGLRILLAKCVAVNVLMSVKAFIV